MSKAHELLIKIKSSLDGNTNASFNKLKEGFKSTEKQVVEFKNAQDKIKNLQVDIKGFEKIQNQISKTELKNTALTKQINDFKNELSTVDKGSVEYKALENAIKALEKEQLKVTNQTKRLKTESEAMSNKLKQEGVSTNRLTSEKTKLSTKSKELKEKIDKLTSSQKKNKDETKSQSDSFTKLSGKMKGLAVAAVGYFSVSALKNYGDEAIGLAKEKIKAETDLQAMLTNTKNLNGDTTAINNASQMLKDYANQLEAVGVIGDETIIAGQAQLATFQLMPSTIKTLTAGMTDMLAKNKGINATQEDATSLANLYGKVMTGQVGALSKYGVTLSANQKKILETGKETERAAMLAKILAENYGGANEALGKTDEGQMTIMKAEIEGVKEEFGKGLLPIQRKFFEIFKTQLPNISKLLTISMDLISGTIKIFESEKAKVFFSKIQNGINTVIDGFQKVKPYIGKIGEYMKKDILDRASFVGKIINDWKPVFSKVVSFVKVAFETLWPVITNLFEKITPVMKKIIEVISPIIAELVTRLIDVGTNYILPLIGKIGKFAEVVVGVISGIVDILAPMFTGITTGAMQGLQGILDFITGIFSGNWKKAWEGIVNIFKGVFDGVAGTVKSVGKLFGLGGDDKPSPTGKPKPTGGKPYTGGYPPNYPKFATGGIIRKPTIAEVGEGGDEEVIIPMNNSSGAKSLLNYANSMIGNKKVVSTAKGQNTSGDTYIFQVTIPVASETIEKAKQVANATMDTLEQRIEKMKKNKRRLSLG